MNRITRTVLVFLMAVALLAVSGIAAFATGASESEGPAGAQAAPVDFPTRPITIVTPWQVGGAAEIAARIFANHLSDELGVRVDVISRTGGTGATGTAFVANSAPNGYTILQAFIGPFAQVPLYLGGDSQYDPLEDFAPLGMYSVEPVVFLAHKDSPWDDMRDFVEDARRNPGVYATGAGGQLSLHALYAGLLYDIEDVDVSVVAYPGALAGVSDLLGGDLHVIAGNPTGLSLYEDLKGLAVLTPERWSALPDIPTLEEQGFEMDAVATWAGYAVHADTPEPIQEILIEAMRKIANSPGFQQELQERVEITVTYADPEEFYKLWVDSLEAVEPAVDWLLAKQAEG
jgi:tripartite-type tricarboxylate transporter receptor subunit TctC